MRGTLLNLHCDLPILDGHFASGRLPANVVLHNSLRPPLSFDVKYELILTAVFLVSESSGHVRRTVVVLAHLLNCCTPNLV